MVFKDSITDPQDREGIINLEGNEYQAGILIEVGILNIYDGV